MTSYLVIVGLWLMANYLVAALLAFRAARSLGLRRGKALLVALSWPAALTGREVF